ncbi:MULTISPECIES: class I adenylate-forming enzyme family protein [unclassified Nocardioides]|uniref:class I adenylate-forming enzyme family protein n=1 Tax=unclassified Nocardioides TaxID=2615069 RepID=UPI00361EB8B6
MIPTTLPRTRPLRTGDWLRLAGRNYPDRIAVLGPHQPVTFTELNARVNRLTTAINDCGVQPGDRVALFSSDSQQYLEALLACMKLGAVFMPMNFRLNAAELQVLMDASQPRLLFHASRNQPVTDRADAGSLIGRVVLDDPGYEELLSRGRDEELDVVVHDSDLACIAYTSGTTGKPKGVLHSQAVVKQNMRSTLLMRGLREDSTHYSAAPMFHISGMYFVLTQVARGATSLLLPDFEAGEVLSWLGSGQVTDAFLVPTMINTLLRDPRVRDTDFSQLRSIAYGGAPMPLPLLREAMDVFGCDFLQPFGAGTEAGTQTALTVEDHRRAVNGSTHLLASIGKPIVGMDLRLCEPGEGEPRDVAPGDVGEIVTRGQAVMNGYLDQPEATARVLHDGWYRGGDMARADEEGYLYLVGRKDDMIIRGGENVYPAEIESVLHSLPEIEDAAVAGVPDEHWGEEVHAWVTLKPGSTFDEHAARESCRSRLAGYKVPVAFHVATELPRTATGKIVKHRLVSSLHP